MNLFQTFQHFYKLLEIDSISLNVFEDFLEWTNEKDSDRGLQTMQLQYVIWNQSRETKSHVQKCFRQTFDFDLFSADGTGHENADMKLFRQRFTSRNSLGYACSQCNSSARSHGWGFLLLWEEIYWTMFSLAGLSEFQVSTHRLAMAKFHHLFGVRPTKLQNLIFMAWNLWRKVPLYWRNGFWRVTESRNSGFIVCLDTFMVINRSFWWRNVQSCAIQIFAWPFAVGLAFKNSSWKSQQFSFDFLNFKGAKKCFQKFLRNRPLLLGK